MSVLARVTGGIEGLPRLLHDVLATGGVTVTTTEPDAADVVLFRSTVYADGDVVVWADPSALGDPALWARHRAEIAQRLSPLAVLHRAVHFWSGVLGGAAFLGSTALLGPPSWTWLVPPALGFVTPLLLRQGLRWGLRGAVRRMGVRRGVRLDLIEGDGGHRQSIP